MWFSPVAQQGCRSRLRNHQASPGHLRRCAQAGSLSSLSATAQFLVWLGVSAYLGGTPVTPATPAAHCWYVKTEAEPSLQGEELLFILTCFGYSALFCIQSLIATRGTHQGRNPIQIIKIIFRGIVGSCSIGLAWVLADSEFWLAPGYMDPQGGGSRGKEGL